MTNKLIEQLSIVTDSKIVLVVIDGLSGIPNESGRTELETANIPNLDALAMDSICGVTRSDSSWDNAWQWPGTPVVVWL